MKVSFACSAFAEIAGYDAWDNVGVLKILHFKGVGSTGSLRNLCGQCRRDGVLVSLSEGLHNLI